jgi:hypothetical protein
MDLLSKVLSLIPVSGRLDVRCHFGAPWAISQGHAAAREIPYHVLLSGDAVLDHGAGVSEKLVAGDIIVFMTGAGMWQSHPPSGVMRRLRSRKMRDLARVPTSYAGVSWSVQCRTVCCVITCRPGLW